MFIPTKITTAFLNNFWPKYRDYYDGVAGTMNIGNMSEFAGILSHKMIYLYAYYAYLFIYLFTYFGSGVMRDDCCCDFHEK